MNSNFFDSNSYFIDEKVNLFKFENCYKVYNDQGENIGSVNQKISAGGKLLRLILNKQMLPFHLEIRNQNNEVEATVSRGWTFFMSKITIADSEGSSVGTIKQKFKLFKPTFTILNNGQEQIAKISGDWKAWNFAIKDNNERQIGSISKKWNGAVKEIFTSADKYNVTLEQGITDKSQKIAVLSGAITIDMVLKESK